jgi:hypothetical protein
LLNGAKLEFSILKLTEGRGPNDAKVTFDDGALLPTCFNELVTLPEILCLGRPLLERPAATIADEFLIEVNSDASGIV